MPNYLEEHLDAALQPVPQANEDKGKHQHETKDAEEPHAHISAQVQRQAGERGAPIATCHDPFPIACPSYCGRFAILSSQGGNPAIIL